MVGLRRHLHAVADAGRLRQCRRQHAEQADRLLSRGDRAILRSADRPVVDLVAGRTHAVDPARSAIARPFRDGKRHVRDHAHWEQAFSGDGGKTWETNWTTEFERMK